MNKTSVRSYIPFRSVTPPKAPDLGVAATPVVWTWALGVLAAAEASWVAPSSEPERPEESKRPKLG